MAVIHNWKADFAGQRYFCTLPPPMLVPAKTWSPKTFKGTEKPALPVDSHPDRCHGCGKVVDFSETSFPSNLNDL